MSQDSSCQLMIVHMIRSARSGKLSLNADEKVLRYSESKITRQFSDLVVQFGHPIQHVVLVNQWR